MKTKELRAIHSTQNAFYKKAFVKEDSDGTQYLYSYYSLIVTNNRNTIKFEKNLALYSNTTMRHVREYLKQIDRYDLAALSKSKLFKKLEETNFVLDIL